MSDFFLYEKFDSYQYVREEDLKFKIIFAAT